MSRVVEYHLACTLSFDRLPSRDLVYVSTLMRILHSTAKTLKDAI
jgi:hypothetical protein